MWFFQKIRKCSINDGNIPKEHKSPNMDQHEEQARKDKVNKELTTDIVLQEKIKALDVMAEELIDTIALKNKNLIEKITELIELSH